MLRSDYAAKFRFLLLALISLASIVSRPPAATGDTAADRVLGQFDFFHNGINIVSNAGLWNPQAVAVDRSVTPNRLYVADEGNHRVLGWHSIDALKNGSSADVVIGQPDFVSWQFQCNNAAVTGATLCVPVGVAVDPGGHLYVADSINNRVLEYDDPFTTDTQPDLVIGQKGNFTTSSCNNGGISAESLCDPTAVAVDKAGNVYIADRGNSRVLEFDSPIGRDVVADSVFGQNGRFDRGSCNANGVSANSLCNPSAVAVDAAGNLYVGDHGNFRVLEYNTPLTGNGRADLVFGQGNNFSSRTNTCAMAPSAGTLCTPDGLAVDGKGNLYISDSSFSRVQEYMAPVASSDTNPDAVFGQPDFLSALCNRDGLGAASLCVPLGLAIDAGNDLFVADFGNQRLVEYIKPLATHPPKTDASLVLGQSTLNRNGVNIAKPQSFYWPGAVAVDSTASPNHLYVADTNNSRVLAWRRAASFTNGAPADLVIGQVDFFSAGCNRNHADLLGNTLPAADTLCLPQGVAVDPAGNLYVADSGNFRVLEYNAPFSAGQSTGFAANLVFGQNGSFTSRVENNGGVSARSMSQVARVTVDSTGNLFVADNLNNRVLEYDRPLLKGTTADVVFGQGGNFRGSDCNFNSGCTRPGCLATASSLCGPSDVVVDSARNVYIADALNNRVLEFFASTTDQTANVVIGQTNFKNVVCGALCGPDGLTLDRRGNLYAADPVSSEVKRYKTPLTIGAAPNLTMGSKQCDQAAARADTLCGVRGLAFDSAGDLYAADTFDNRVLQFNRPNASTPTPTRKATRTPTATPRRTPTPTPKRTATRTPTRTATATPVAGPVINSVPPVILAGANFKIDGSGFTPGSRVNFYVATATGPLNTGPFKPAFTPTQLTVGVPASNPLGEGVVVVEVVNTDQDFVRSNIALALLQGNPADGIPSITGINSIPLSPDSTELGIAVANVRTVVHRGTRATLDGMGFDTANGVAVDLFCACPKHKVGPFYVNPGSNLTHTTVSFLVPASGPDAPLTGPGSFVVSNKGGDGKFRKKSNAVSVPIGQRITVTSVSQNLRQITVVGAGFSTVTVINLFNVKGGVVVNLGGYNADGTPKIPLTFVSQSKFTFKLPAAASPGPAYVQALNPPFVPFTSSGSDPGGSITLH